MPKTTKKSNGYYWTAPKGRERKEMLAAVKLTEEDVQGILGFNKNRFATWKKQSGLFDNHKWISLTEYQQYIANEKKNVLSTN